MTPKPALLYLIVICLSFAGLERASSQSPDTATDTFESFLKAEDPTISDSTVEEIMAIRNRLGGGIGLSGQSFKFCPIVSDKRQKFDQQSKTATGSPCRDKSDCPTVALATKSRSEELFFASLAMGQKSSLRPESLPAVAPESIRAIARQLERIAADMEDLTLFDDADGIRARVAQLREQARKTQIRRRQSLNADSILR